MRLKSLTTGTLAATLLFAGAALATPASADDGYALRVHGGHYRDLHLGHFVPRLYLDLGYVFGHRHGHRDARKHRGRDRDDRDYRRHGRDDRHWRAPRRDFSYGGQRPRREHRTHY